MLSWKHPDYLYITNVCVKLKTPGLFVYNLDYEHSQFASRLTRTRRYVYMCVDANVMILVQDCVVFINAWVSHDNHLKVTQGRHNSILSNSTDSTTLPFIRVPICVIHIRSKWQSLVKIDKAFVIGFLQFNRFVLFKRPWYILPFIAEFF